MKHLVAAFLEELDDAEALSELAARLAPYLDENEDRLLSSKEAADRLGLHPETLSKMARDGRIHAKKVGREWRFRTDRLAISPRPSRYDPEAMRVRSRDRQDPPAVAAIRGR